jgi:hypothetical protein
VSVQNWRQTENKLVSYTQDKLILQCLALLCTQWSQLSYCVTRFWKCPAN